MYHPPETQVTPLTTVRRERMLPVPGTMQVRIGDRVEPTQVVARANVPGDFYILPAARTLGIAASRLKRHMRVKPGERVQRDQVIARRGRIFAHTVKSPTDGMVALVGGGRVLIEANPTPLDLRAYIYGTVSNVLPPYGVVIETPGAVIQGAWGAGGESIGVLKCLVTGPDEPLEAQMIDPSCNGTILVGGIGLGDAPLERAQQLQVRGIVVGSLSPELISRTKELPFPIIVTEGLGEIPMSRPIFRLLTTNAGREASISGRVQTRWGIVRPEIVIPLPAETVPPAKTDPGMPLEVGSRVRLVRAPHIGTAGTVVALPGHARRIQTGAVVYGAEVDLGQEAPVFVPLANLEVLR